MENEKKNNKVIGKIIIAVVCILAIGAIVFVASGGIKKISCGGEKENEESISEKYFSKGVYREEDKVTPKLIDEGYYHEINKTVEEDIFKVELVGLAGDDNNPILMLDIYVDDEEIVEKYDVLCMEICALGESQYETQKDVYGYRTVYAEKSDEDSNCYHVAERFSPAWVGNNKTTLVGIKSIEFEIDDETIGESFELEMEFKFTAPENCLKSTRYVYCESQDFILTNEIKEEDRVVKYIVEGVSFGSYKSIVDVNFVEQVDNDNGIVDVLALFSDWKVFAENIVIIADGVEYSCMDSGYSFSDMNEDGMSTIEDSYGMWLSFSGIDFSECEKIEIKCGDEVYTVK